MNTGNAAKETTNISVECHAKSANPASLVGMEFFIGTIKQGDTVAQITEAPGSYNGTAKTFVFTFTTNRNMTGMIAGCHLLWDGIYMNEKKENMLNITCE